ncbi:MAG: hypothetical protein KBS58_02700 [Bacteroidales bacterium]|nr:hypothetical protein [Candidatus Cacconaster equi]
MKRFFVALLLLSCAVAGAQNRFSCDFKLYDKKSETKPLVSGIAYVQDNCYRIESAEGFVVGNGITRWLYRAKSEELVIEDDDSSIFQRLTLVQSSESTATVTYSKYRAELTEIKSTEKLPVQFFSVDVKSLGPNVITTDLRD